MKNIKKSNFPLSLIIELLICIGAVLYFLYLSIIYRSYLYAAGMIPFCLDFIRIVAKKDTVKFIYIFFILIGIIIIFIPVGYYFLKPSIKFSVEYCSQRKEAARDVLKEGQDKYSCFTNLAMQERDPNYCLYLSPPKKFSCLDVYSYNYNVKDICSKVVKSDQEKEDCEVGLCKRSAYDELYDISVQQDCIISLAEK